TISGRLSTLETVATETPACAATSLILTGTFNPLLEWTDDSLGCVVGTCQTGALRSSTPIESQRQTVGTKHKPVSVHLPAWHRWLAARCPSWPHPAIL